MNKPSLRVTQWLGDIPVEGECTVCLGKARFHVAGIHYSREGNQKALQEAFGLHLKTVHVRDTPARSNDDVK